MIMYNIFKTVYSSSKYVSTLNDNSNSILREQRVYLSTTSDSPDTREPDIRALCKLNMEQIGMNCDRLESGVWEYLEQMYCRCDRKIIFNGTLLRRILP